MMSRSIARTKLSHRHPSWVGFREDLCQQTHQRLWDVVPVSLEVHYRTGFRNESERPSRLCGWLGDA